MQVYTTVTSVIAFSHKRENANIYYALLEILELNNIY